MKCVYCGCSDDELRPYGPNGSMVCFACAMLTPDREEETKKNFISQLETISGVAVIGSDAGPYPLEHNPVMASIVKDLLEFDSSAKHSVQ